MTKYILTTTVEINADLDIVQTHKVPKEAERAIREFLVIWQKTLQNFTNGNVIAILSKPVSIIEGEPKWGD